MLDWRWRDLVLGLPFHRGNSLGRNLGLLFYLSNYQVFSMEFRDLPFDLAFEMVVRDLSYPAPNRGAV